MILSDEVLETEVGLVTEVIGKVRERDFLSVEDDGFGGHQLHQTFSEKPYQQLLEKGQHHASLRGNVLLSPLVLRSRCRVE